MYKKAYLGFVPSWAGTPYREIIYIDPNKTASTAKNEFYNRFKYDFDDNESFIDVRVNRFPEEDLYLYEEKIKTKTDITYFIKRKKWKENMLLLVRDNPKSKCLIYSGEWNRYWGENYCGYVNERENAGIYDISDAWEHISHVGLEKEIQLIIQN